MKTLDSFGRTTFVSTHELMHSEESQRSQNGKSGEVSISATHRCCDMVVGIFLPEWTHWMGSCPKLWIRTQSWVGGGLFTFWPFEMLKLHEAVSPWRRVGFPLFWCRWTRNIKLGGDPSKNHGHGAVGAPAIAIFPSFIFKISIHAFQRLDDLSLFL
jgi:hypothetical protein